MLRSPKIDENMVLSFTGFYGLFALAVKNDDENIISPAH
jgi:hypothetical protein